MATGHRSEENKDEKETEEEFKYFSQAVLEPIDYETSTKIFDPTEHPLSCCFSIGMLIVSLFFVFGLLTAIYWSSFPVVRLHSKTGSWSEWGPWFLVYFVYIPLVYMLAWGVAVAHHYHHQRQYRVNLRLHSARLHVSMGRRGRSSLPSPTAISRESQECQRTQGDRTNLCVLHFQSGHGSLPILHGALEIVPSVSISALQRVDSFIHETDDRDNQQSEANGQEMVKRILCVHYYLINAYLQIYKEYILPTEKNQNGTSQSVADVRRHRARFESGIVEFNTTVRNADHQEQEVDAVQLMYKIQGKHKYRYTANVAPLFPFYQLAIVEVERRLAFNTGVALADFARLRTSYLLEAKGEFVETYMVREFKPFYVLQMVTFCVYLALQWYVIVYLYDPLASFEYYSTNDLLFPAIYDVVVVLMAVLLYAIDSKFTMRDFMMYVMQYYQDFETLEKCLILNQKRTLVEIFGKYVCPIYCHYQGRLLTVDLTMKRFGDDVGPIIIEYCYGVNLAADTTATKYLSFNVEEAEKDTDGTDAVGLLSA
eukprot:CAMPEP_0197080592 /NCGR_PEP_ID=MMETSP1384-20130603/214210_1 /TAXON_ID=29189 /ORGANISM="Ammonia sp." /LENGTH=539 /DNA_ID=CAMNT_0042519481 /DNA_START=14 /DNA_END=1634 /DNA_ORIENTATION=-